MRERNANRAKKRELNSEKTVSKVVDIEIRRIASAPTFAAGSRGITRHKGNAKYITKLHRATKLEISFGSFQLNVAQIGRECSDSACNNSSDTRHAISPILKKIVELTAVRSFTVIYIIFVICNNPSQLSA